MSDSLKEKATKGVLWSTLERFSVQGVQFFLMIFMARLLTPNDYGLIGMLSIFLAIAQSLIDSGFSQALIRKQNRTEIDKSTVFYFNIVVSGALYLILFISAPYVSDFYNEPELKSIMRAMCLTIVIGSFSIVQYALLTINVDFKKIAKISLISISISGVIGVLLAYKGLGVWAIVYQSLLNSIINCCLIWILAKWKPQKSFSWESFNELFSFGSKLLASGLLDTLYRNIYPLIIGKAFSASDLGYYTRALHFSEFPSSNVTGVLQKVTYPILCSIQNNDDRLRDIYRRFLKMSAFIVFPLMTGLAAVSHPFINLIIGEKWSFCAVLLQIICFNMMWYPIHAINLNLLQVKGRSDLYLRLEFIKKIVGIIIIIITVPLGLVAMCYGGVTSSLICLFINTYYTGKLINVSFFMQMRDLLPTFILSIAMFIIILYTIHFISNIFLQLFIGIVIGMITYIGSSYILKFNELKEVLSILKRK